MDKVYKDAASAMAGLVKDGMTIMAGGFGLCGIPETLIEAIRDSGAKNLTFISNNAGVDGIGLGRLLETRQITKMISSYVGENKLFAQQYLSGELRLEFNPQGTLAERIRAGGAGIPAFFTKTGVGTLIAEGKEEREFDGERYIMERGLFADIAVVHAWTGDTEGNLVYRKTARNFNPMMASAAKVTVAEVEHLVPAGEIEPDQIHTPGIFVKRIVHVANPTKHIEQRTTRKRTDKSSLPGQGRKSNGLDPRPNGGPRREGTARRLLCESRHRHSDAGIELHPYGHARAAAIAKTACSAWGRSRLKATRMPTSSMRASRPSPNCRRPVISRVGRFLRHDPRRPYRPVDPGRHAGGAERRSRQLDDPRQDGEGDGRRHGPGGRREARCGGHGAHRQGRSEAAQGMQSAADGSRVVDLVITDLGVFSIDKKGGSGMTLIELADGVTADEIKAKTAAEFKVALDSKQSSAA